MTHVLRPATVEDIVNMLRVQRSDGFSHAYYLNPDRVARLFHRGEWFIVAEVNKKVVGFAAVDLEIRATLHFLSVDASYLGKGIGSSLMLEVMRDVKSRGYDRINCYVEAGAKIEEFLKKFGYQKVGYYKNRYGQEKDATIWEAFI